MRAGALIDFLSRQTRSERENDRLHADLTRVWGIANRATKQRDAANERADRAEAERDAAYLTAAAMRTAMDHSTSLIARVDGQEPTPAEIDEAWRVLTAALRPDASCAIVERLNDVARLQAEVEMLAERNGRLTARLEQYEPVEVLP